MFFGPKSIAQILWVQALDGDSVNGLQLMANVSYSREPQKDLPRRSWQIISFRQENRWLGPG